MCQVVYYGHAECETIGELLSTTGLSWADLKFHRAYVGLSERTLSGETCLCPVDIEATFAGVCDVQMTDLGYAITPCSDGPGRRPALR